MEEGAGVVEGGARAAAGPAAGARHEGALIGLRLFPADPEQALRLRRFLMAAATALLVVFALFLGSASSLMPLDAAVAGTALIAGTLALFFVLFRSGLNLRFADPSLTTEQIAAAILVLAYVSYHAEAARAALSSFYMVALLFGALHLRTRRLLALATLALAAHSAVIGIAYLREPALDPRPVFLQLAVLAIVLPWTAVMGGYVNRLRSRLERIAIRDELTGVYNRRFLMETLGRERSRAQRLAGTFSVCLIDIDHFKAINDTLGHAAGDAVLVRFADCAKTALRDLDIFGRYGGEEFLAILPSTGPQGALICAERIRAGIEAAGILRLRDAGRVTVTLGVASHRKGEETAELLARADGALYEGKGSGRNRVVAVD